MLNAINALRLIIGRPRVFARMFGRSLFSMQAGRTAIGSVVGRQTLVNVVPRTTARSFVGSCVLRDEQQNRPMGGNAFASDQTSATSSGAGPSEAPSHWAAAAKAAEEAAAMQRRASSDRPPRDAGTQLWKSMLGALQNQPDSFAINTTSRRSAGHGVPKTWAEAQEEIWLLQPTFGAGHAPARPSDGRVVEVDRRRGDVARSYSQLNSILRRNNVRHELALGERYEKPNQRRRRLASERHRRRFANMVREKVQLVRMRCFLCLILLHLPNGLFSLTLDHAPQVSRSISVHVHNPIVQ